MQQENELKKVCQKRDMEPKVLFAQNRLLQTITKQSGELQELRQQLKTEQRERQEEQRQQKREKDDLVEYYTPQFQLILKENQELTDDLNELNRSSSNLDPPSQTISHSSSFASSATSIDGCQDEETQQLEKFLSGGEKFNVESKPENLVRKLEVVKGLVMRDRAKMQLKLKRIIEDAKLTEQQLLQVVKEREERLQSTSGQIERGKAVFNDVYTKLVSQVDSLKTDLEKEKMENQRLRNSNQTTERIETCSDSAGVIDIDEFTKSASDSFFNYIGDDGDGADTASIASGLSSNCVANSSESVIITSTISAPLFKRGITFGKSTNLIDENLKNSWSDGGEASRKLKSQTDLDSLDESAKDSETKTNWRIMELEREISDLTFKLRAEMAYNVELQQALKKINLDTNEVSKESAIVPDTGMDETGHRTTTENEVPRSPPVIPITREEARIFSTYEEFLFATFSEKYYLNASRHESFLVYKPIVIDNPGRTFCYMNSVVQALSSISPFAVTLSCGVDSKEGSLLHAMYQTYKHVWVRRPDSWNNNRPPILNTKELRSYYAQNHNVNFDPDSQHDAQEFLEDLISKLESEVSEICGGVEEMNLVTRLFRGYMVAPDGTKEYFRNLRLSIEDERIDSVKNALLYHLINWSPRPAQPVPLAVPVPVNSNSPSTTNVDQEENVTITGKTDVSLEVELQKNKLEENTSSSRETDHFQMPHEIAVDNYAKPTSKSTEAVSTCDETGGYDAYQNADAVQADFSFERLITGKSIKIYTPEILCVSLNRHTIDYCFNFKVLPAEDLTIPAELRAPEGMTRPAHYKLMSIVQYIPAGISSGHYYTYLMPGKGYACMLNDDIMTYVDIDDSYLCALDGRSSIFVYAKRPENLELSPGLDQ